MPSTPEGYNPRPDEIRSAEATMDDRQRELTETREDALHEGRIQGAEQQLQESNEKIDPDEKLDNDVFAVIEGRGRDYNKLTLEYIQQGLEDLYKHYEIEEIKQSLSRLQRQGKIIRRNITGSTKSYWKITSESEGK